MHTMQVDADLAHEQHIRNIRENMANAPKPIPREDVLETKYGRFEYVSDPEYGHRYLHVDCDVLCGKDGCCWACGAPSPAAITPEKGE
mgnify:CR=1 FL=1